MIRKILLAGLLLLPLAATQAKAAAMDGRWSVLVITEKGDCDRGYRYEVNVAGSKVNYVGTEAGVSMDGSVSPSGHINIGVGRAGSSKADGRATGSGRLTANGGAGTWSANGSGKHCSGRWEAERR